MTVIDVTTKSEEPELTLETAFKKRDQLKTKKGANWLIWGPPGAGKTYFAMTFPQPIYIIDTDGGAIQLLNHFPNKDIRIMDVTEPYTEEFEKKKKGDPLSATDPIVSLQKFDKATMLLKDVTEGTIVVDSITEVWEWFGAWIEIVADKYTQSGQMMRTEWGKANSKYTWMLKRLQSRPCNFVMTAKQKKLYDLTGKETEAVTVAAQKFTEYQPDFVIHLSKELKPTVNIKTGQITDTKMERVGIITKCRFYDDLSSTPIVNPTYEALKERYKGKVPDNVFL